MDVLQLIKEDHESLRISVKELAVAKTVRSRKEIAARVKESVLQKIHVEQELLFPEAEACLDIQDSFFNISHENHKLLQRVLRRIQAILKKDAADIKKSNHFNDLYIAVDNHCDLIESLLMPRMRKGISTQDREDLGIIYAEQVGREIPKVKSRPVDLSIPLDSAISP